jgi:23S rRNA (uracil1939-C5)-methyltransferase
VSNLQDCAAVIDQVEMENWDPCSAAVIIADPSRQGLGKGGVASIDIADAPVLVLVSCDPVAGARDARLLTDIGYELGDVEVLDIFPNTHHVEVVSVFTREPAED